MSGDGSAAPRRVVIVGGGFGGLAAAHALRRAEASVTVVDRTNHHLFQPLLYQVAGGGLSSGDCATPIRSLLRRQANVQVLMAEVTGLDAERRRVTLDRGEELAYDSLIVACGAETSYFGHDEWAEVSCGLKTLGDAVDLRNRIFGAFEEAERATDPTARAEWLTFAVVGGGPTGVEIAGQLAVLAQHSMRRDFTRIDSGAARVILLDAGERLVPAFRPRLSARVGRALAELGVTVREGARVTAIDARGVTVEQDGRSERIAARTVVWAAGVRTAGVAGALAQATGAATDRAGRVAVGPTLTVAGHPEISVIGDAADVRGADGRPLPGLATVAIQQARHVAQALRARRAGRHDAVPLLRQGRARRRRPRARGLRGSRPRLRRRRRLPDLPRRPPLLPGQRRAGPAAAGADGVGVGRARRASEPRRRRPAGERGAAGAAALGMSATGVVLAASSQLAPARSQMAFTLGFHIILASVGVAFPAMMLIAHFRGLRHDDADALRLAQRWSKVTAVTVAVGAVTGTVLSFEFGLLWPAFTGRFGGVFGILFTIEGIFFFLEAIFVAIYIFGWKRLSGWAHFLTGVPIVIAGLGGAASVVAVNSWMNQPQGFTLTDGEVTDVDPWKVIFNPAVSYEVPHMILAAYLVTGFLVASVYAVGMLRGRRDRYHRLGPPDPADRRLRRDADPVRRRRHRRPL